MGLGAQAGAADKALSQSWFFAYNLLAAALALSGAVVAIMLVRRPDNRIHRLLRGAAWAACAVLSLRGIVGVVALAVQFFIGVIESPLVLIAIEPWFLLGGVLFGALAAKTRAHATGPDRGAPR